MSYINVSINKFVIVKLDSICTSCFFLFSTKTWQTKFTENFVYKWWFVISNFFLKLLSVFLHHSVIRQTFIWLVEIDKIFIIFRFFLRFQVVHLQNYWLYFFDQVCGGHFSLRRKLLDNLIAIYVTCIGDLMSQNLRKVQFLGVFSL